MYLFNDDDESSSIKIKDETKCDKVVEISVSTLRSCEGSATCLVARLESGLHLAYRFVWRSTKDSSRLLLLRRVRGAAFQHRTKSSRQKENNETSILPFHDVTLHDATYSCDGMFCTGTTSPFFLSLQRGRVVATKMLHRLDGEDDNEITTAFVPFHTPFVNRGFILCKTSSSTSSSSLEICRFDTIQSNREGDKDTQRRATTFGETCGLDGSVNVRHVCLGCSVHNILYLGKHGAVSGCRAEDFIPIYVLATSYRAAPNRFDASKDRKRKRNVYEEESEEKENDDDDVLHEGVTNEFGFDADESFTTDEQFELQIVLGDRWRVVKRLKLEKSERIVTIKCLMLRRNINAIPQAYIVVGT